MTSIAQQLLFYIKQIHSVNSLLISLDTTDGEASRLAVAGDAGVAGTDVQAVTIGVIEGITGPVVAVRTGEGDIRSTATGAATEACERQKQSFCLIHKPHAFHTIVGSYCFVGTTGKFFKFIPAWCTPTGTVFGSV